MNDTSIYDKGSFELTTYDLLAIIFINIGSFLLIWFTLRLILKVPTTSSNDTDTENTAILKNESSTSTVPVLHAGEVGGDYSKNWTKTFDLVLLIYMIIYFVIMGSITTFIYPLLWGNWRYWCKNISIAVLQSIILFLSGLLARHFCAVDEIGYIITNKDSPFKINYTRKMLNFTVFILPLISTQIDFGEKGISDVFDLLWGNWFVTLNAVLTIKPLREKYKFFMILFNSYDRPEDRPNTIMWLVILNIPAIVISAFFLWLYPKTGVSTDFVMIFTLANLIGDGIAEPVGIYFGMHRYKVYGCCTRAMYERSLEGSASVFLATMLIVSVFWNAFNTRLQFWLTMVSFPLIITFTEALSPHTADTSFIHGIGGITLLITSHVHLQWK